MLRFALEKTKVDIVIGLEGIHPRDSVHYVRGGLDQILCKIAKSKGKKVGFVVSDILGGHKGARVLSRMAFNLKLCKKYGVETVWFGCGMPRNDVKALLHAITRQNW